MEKKFTIFKKSYGHITFIADSEEHYKKILNRYLKKGFKEVYLEVEPEKENLPF